MRRKAVLLAVITLTLAQLAAAAELSAPFDDISQLDLSPSLSMFFKSTATTVTSDDGMVMFEPPAVDVLVARITEDGQLVTGCFATEEALRRFLDRNHRVESPVSQEK